MAHLITTMAVAFLILSTTLAYPLTFPGGDIDERTPQIRLLKPRGSITTGEPIKAVVKVSRSFTICLECATDSVTEYAAEPQGSLQGHVHVYAKRLRGINAWLNTVKVDMFCPFNRFNPSTQVQGQTIRGSCPAITAPGRYRVCAVLETDAHAQRVKAAPRDYPPIDCHDIMVRRPGRRDTQKGATP